MIGQDVGRYDLRLWKGFEDMVLDMLSTMMADRRNYVETEQSHRRLM